MALTLRGVINSGRFLSDYFLSSAMERTFKGRLGERDRNNAFKALRTKYLRVRELDLDHAEAYERWYRHLLGQLGFAADHIRGRFWRLSAGEDGPAVALALLLGSTEEPDGRDAIPDGRDPPVLQLQRRLNQSADGAAWGFLLAPDRMRLLRRDPTRVEQSWLEFPFEDVFVAGESGDPDSFRALWALCRAAAMLPGEDGRSLLDEIAAASEELAERVSEDLKRAVFEAADTMLRALIKADHPDPEDRVKLTDQQLAAYKRDALVFLYRLLYILFSEEQDHRLADSTIYQSSYSVHQLVQELLYSPAEDYLPDCTAIWERLRACAALLASGATAGDLSVGPRAGELFEDAPDSCLPRVALGDDIMRGVVLSLSTTRPKLARGLERVSFRELRVEQLGAVYEGLLEYEARIAEEPLWVAKLKGREYALAETDIERLQQFGLRRVDRTVATDPLAEEVDEVGEEEEAETEEEEEAAEEEEEVGEKVKKGDRLVLTRALRPGDVFLAPGHGRKATGTFYTVPPIVDFLVRKALTPLAEAKSSAEILRLRVIDPAMGSGHFLVGACRFLAEHLLKAYRNEYADPGRPPSGFRGRWDDHDEALAWCKRQVAQHCLYGVDLNPEAVRLARVALWIETGARDEPLLFLEHRFRTGDSLIGGRLEMLPRLPGGVGGGALWAGFRRGLEEAMAAALQKARDIDARPDRDPEDLRWKERLYREERGALEPFRPLFDAWTAAWCGLEAEGMLDDVAAALSGRAGDKQNASLEEIADWIRSRGWWDRVRHMAERRRFFHWELEFPEVWFKNDGSPNPEGGFDAVLGNPPWDKVISSRKEFYSRYDILIRNYTGKALDARIQEIRAEYPDAASAERVYADVIEQTSTFLKRSGTYPFMTGEAIGQTLGGHVDLFKAFTERFWQLLRPGGRSGVLVPGGIYTLEGCTGIRYMLLDKTAVEAFYGLENRRKIFPIDSREKFVCLVFRKADVEDQEFCAAFVRHDLSELSHDGPMPWVVTVKRSELEFLSPGNLAFLEYRSPQDREVLLKMYEENLLLGDAGPGTWNARFYAEFNITTDSGLWTDTHTGRLYTPRQILGFEPGEVQETRDRMSEKGFWPLYQDAHIHQYVVEFKPIMRWVNLEAHERKYGRMPDPNPKLVIRDPARNTDERTCIAALLSPNSCFGHTLNGVASDSNALEHLAALLNSITFDFGVRLKVAGQHVSPYLLQKCPALAPADVACLLPPPTISGNQSQTWIYDIEDLWPALWVLERGVAESYGLAAGDFEHILDSFPVFARKRAGFCAYLRERLAGC